jgi:hypothetical protein
VTPSVNQQVENLAEWTRDVHDGARKMIVAEGDQNVTDDDSTITHPEMISDELASHWAQD